MTAGADARHAAPLIPHGRFRRRARRCPSALAVASQPIRRRVAAREPCGAMEEVCARFVSQKISKARWRPLPAAALQPPDLFATGSWDNEVARRGSPASGSSAAADSRRGAPLRELQVKAACCFPAGQPRLRLVCGRCGKRGPQWRISRRASAAV